MKHQRSGDNKFAAHVCDIDQLLVLCGYIYNLLSRQYVMISCSGFWNIIWLYSKLKAQDRADCKTNNLRLNFHRSFPFSIYVSAVALILYFTSKANVGGSKYERNTSPIFIYMHETPKAWRQQVCRTCLWQRLVACSLWLII